MTGLPWCLKATLHWLWPVKLLLLYKHQWDTEWEFRQKHDVFTCEDDMLSLPAVVIYKKHAFGCSKMIKYFIGLYLTNRFQVAVRLFSNRSLMTSKCGKNKKVVHEAQPSVSLMFLPHFDFLCDLLLNRRTATWNLFVLYNKELKYTEKKF